MEIYYLNSEEFLKEHDEDFLRQYSDGKEFKSGKRFLEYSLGRYLVKKAASDVFGLKNTEIIIENDKPVFKSGEIHFSISHCGNIVAVAFDKVECGLDIEEIKPRDFASLGKRYNRDFQTPEDFYSFWTEYEAEIKLQTKPKGKYSCIFQDKFMLTVLSANKITGVGVKELKF